MTDIKQHIELYGKQIDEIIDSAETDRLADYLSELVKIAMENEYPEIYYYLGTGYGEYASCLIRDGEEESSPHVLNTRSIAFRYFRHAIDIIDQSVLIDTTLFLRIITNYANCLNSAGRVIEALRLYRMILEVNPTYSIARGNYGRSLQFLANMVNDDEHYNVLHHYAYQAFKVAVASKDTELYEEAKRSFQESIVHYENKPIKDIVTKPIKNNAFSLEDEEESKYRRWCLEKHLFLNPLNELLEFESGIAHDPLTIATIVELDPDERRNADPPRWFAMLNQLKEEFVYARYLCYASSEDSEEIHMSDRNVSLSLGSFDYSCYSFRIEQIKSAFRLLYSMLDQICFL